MRDPTKRQVETDCVEINKKKEGKKWFSGTSFISEFFLCIVKGGQKIMSPTIYQVIPVQIPILQQRAAHKLLSKSYRDVSQCFLDSLLSLCFSPFPTFPLPIIHYNLPQFWGLSSPEVPQRLSIQKRMHHFSWGKKGKPFRERDMGLSSFLHLITTSACWSQPRNMVR